MVRERCTTVKRDDILGICFFICWNSAGLITSWFVIELLLNYLQISKEK
jgi:hypothetical protein